MYYATHDFLFSLQPLIVNKLPFIVSLLFAGEMLRVVVLVCTNSGLFIIGIFSPVKGNGVFHTDAIFYTFVGAPGFVRMFLQLC